MLYVAKKSSYVSFCLSCCKTVWGSGMVPIKIRSTLSFIPPHLLLPPWMVVLQATAIHGFVWRVFVKSNVAFLLLFIWSQREWQKISSRNFSCFQNPTFTLRHGELSSSLIGTKHRSKFIKGIISYKKLDQYSFIRATVTVCHLNIFIYVVKVKLFMKFSSRALL